MFSRPQEERAAPDTILRVLEDYSQHIVLTFVDEDHNCLARPERGINGEALLHHAFPGSNKWFASGAIHVKLLRVLLDTRTTRAERIMTTSQIAVVVRGLATAYPGGKSGD
jgi:hypothetical protein